jgi:hypothetical protein
MALVKVNIDSFKRDAGGLLNRLADKVVNKLEDKLENAVEDLFAKGLKKIGLSDNIAAELSARFGDALTSGLEDKYFQTFTSEMKRASCADIRNNFNPNRGNIVGASRAAETYVDAIQRASNSIMIDGRPTMQFPSHISDKYFMSFKFRKYQRPSPHTASTLAFAQAFALPLPKGIRESFEIDIGQESTGMAGGVADAAQRYLAPGDGKNKAAALGDAAKALVYGKMVQAAGDLGSIIGQAVGAVPNPHIQALFSGVPLRQHRFEWTFAPRNAAESRELMKVLQALKAFSLPSYSSLGTAALAYPFLCEPAIMINGKSSEWIKFMPCLIQSVEINYSPQGIPAFFEGTSHPAFIEVSVSMLETQIHTANDYADGVAGLELGGDRISEAFSTFKDQIQKGLEAAGSDINIDEELDTATKAIQRGLSDKQE